MLATERNKELLPFTTEWMELESIILSEISQKPGGERQIPYDLTCKWNQINKTNKQGNMTRDTEIKNKLQINRGEAEGK